MTLLEQLAANKGTVSSALGKSIAAEIVSGSGRERLSDCIKLTCHELDNAAAKGIRAGAAKVVEIVAEAKPEWVAADLEKLLPALGVPEPQTRWMIIRVMGFCAHLNEPVALRALPYASRFIESKDGLIVASSADLYLGDFGATSATNAARVFPTLKLSMETTLKNEQDWLLEALFTIVELLPAGDQETVFEYAERWKDSPRKSTRKRSMRILALKSEAS